MRIMRLTVTIRKERHEKLLSIALAVGLVFMSACIPKQEPAATGVLPAVADLFVFLSEGGEVCIAAFQKRALDLARS